MYDVMESLQMRQAEDIDSCYLLRYQFKPTTMVEAAAVLAEFHKTSDAVVVNVVDEMVASSGTDAWRCCKIFFYAKADITRHVCEVTIVLNTMVPI